MSGDMSESNTKPSGELRKKRKRSDSDAEIKVDMPAAAHLLDAAAQTAENVEILEPMGMPIAAKPVSKKRRRTTGTANETDQLDSSEVMPESNPTSAPNHTSAQPMENVVTATVGC